MSALGIILGLYEPHQSFLAGLLMLLNVEMPYWQVPQIAYSCLPFSFFSQVSTFTAGAITIIQVQRSHMYWTPAIAFSKKLIYLVILVLPDECFVETYCNPSLHCTDTLAGHCLKHILHSGWLCITFMPMWFIDCSWISICEYSKGQIYVVITQK